MAMEITQKMLDRAALVLVVGEDGLYEWSSTKTHGQIAGVLEGIADDLRDTEGE